MKKNRSRFTKTVIGFLLILCMLFGMGVTATPGQQAAPPDAAAADSDGADNSLTAETDPTNVPGEIGEQDDSAAPKTTAQETETIGGTEETEQGSATPAPKEPASAAVSVSGFASLANHVAKQSYAAGEVDGVSGLDLPDALSASNVDHGFDITGVTWAAAPAFDPNTAGEYIFTAVLPKGYALEQGAVLPVISVTIEAAPPQIQARAMLQSANEIQPQVDETLPGNGDYEQADIAAMNAIIEAHPEMGLKKWTDGPTPPEGWNEEATSSKDTVVSWIAGRDDTPKRINGLWVAGRNLIGELNVTGLSALQTLDCSDNKLTGLNVSGLAKLEILYCNNNQLTALDLTGATALKELICQENKLSALDVSQQTNLQTLLCWRNALCTVLLQYSPNLIQFDGKS